MRTHVLLLAGFCLLSSPAFARAAQDAKAQEAKAQEAKPKERKEIKVTEKVLKPYVGEYAMTEGRVLTITLENGSLWGQPTDQQKRQLFPESPTKFFLKDLDVQVTFQKDPKGAVVGLVMDQAGRPQRELKKIK
jgi:Domain of unknown function (DUF3471)